MQFYDREQEVRKLREIELRSHEVAQFTVVTGRRRVGKSSLILKACENCTFAYLFVERKSEKDLCEGFAAELELKLGMQFYGTRLGNWWDRRGENELDLVRRTSWTVACLSRKSSVTSRESTLVPPGRDLRFSEKLRKSAESAIPSSRPFHLMTCKVNSKGKRK